MGRTAALAFGLVLAVTVSCVSARAGLADPTPAPSVSPAASSGPSASPSPTATNVITSWLGVTLGESSKQLRAQLGKPLAIVPTSVGDLWRYNVDGGNATLEVLFDQDQVLNIAARIKAGKQSALADPLGGSLGMSAQALQSARGTPIATYDDGNSLAYGDVSGIRWFYTVDGGSVTSIEVSRPVPTPSAAQVVADASHDGSSIARALQVKAGSDADATSAELSYLHGLPCDDANGAWMLGTQELVSAGGRYFDVLHVTCPSTKQQRDFYFDITDNVGK